MLQFTERDVSIIIRKVLASAVANAQHNDEQDPESCYVTACFADEGPTLKRFRPRARGRATRIRKRTCHITVIVGPHDATRSSSSVRPQGGAPADPGRRRPRRRGRPAASRRERVDRSRQAAAASVRAGEAAHDHDPITTDDADEESTDRRARGDRGTPTRPIDADVDPERADPTRR